MKREDRFYIYEELLKCFIHIHIARCGTRELVLDRNQNRKNGNNKFFYSE